MAEPRPPLRRSNRIRASLQQTQIVGVRGRIGYARDLDNIQEAPVANHNRNQIQTKALPIDHSPPWSLSELKSKWVVALQSMARAHNLVPGHKPKKQDWVKLLYDYGQLQQQQQQQNDQQQQQLANQPDPG